MNKFAFKRFSKETKDIIVKMLDKNPDNRITPQEALNHNFFILNGFSKDEDRNNIFQKK